MRTRLNALLQVIGLVVCFTILINRSCTCTTAAAAFDIQAVTLEPEVVPPAGTLKLLVDVINKQPSVTAGAQLSHHSA